MSGEKNFPGVSEKEAADQATRQLADEKRRQVRDMRKLLRLPEFQRFAWRKLGESGVFRSSFSLNTKMEDFREGQRDLGILLLQEINDADENMFAKMQRDSVSEALGKANQPNKELENV